MIKKVGIITAGGDCPGLNAVIRGIVKTAEYKGIETYGFLEGYKGLLENRCIKLDSYITSGTIHKGGTILGSIIRQIHLLYLLNGIRRNSLCR